MTKKYSKIISVIMALLILAAVVVIPAGAVQEAEEPCFHVNLGVALTSYSRKYVNEDTHAVIKTTTYTCLDCGEKISFSVTDRTEAHNLLSVKLLSDYHSGKYHYYTRLYKCNICVSEITRTEPIPCSGPPCPEYYD